MCAFISLFVLGAFLMTGSGAASAREARKAVDDENIVEIALELMEVTEDLRGLEFLYNLPVDLVTQEEIGEIIQRELDRQITEEMDRTFSSMYAALGLLPREVSLRSGYEAMVEEQAAGLYDPREKRLYVVDIDISSMLSQLYGGSDNPLANFLGGFMEGFLEGMGLDITSGFIIHELTHALDDQHFNIEGNMERLMEADSDDAQLAYQSLLEGNATRTMNDYTYAAIGLDPAQTQGMAETNLAVAEGLMNYDPFLERVLTVPYLKGEEFVRYLYDLGGNDEINEAFLDPPASMEQILHPERYTPNRDDPSIVDDPDLSSALPAWEHEASDTLGELMISLVFELQTFDRASSADIADGWDGDRITTWGGPTGEVAFAWVTVWDDEWEAEEFFDAYRHLIEIKYIQGSGEWSGDSSAAYSSWDTATGVEISGRRVVIVEGVFLDDLEDCLDAAWETQVAHR